MVNQSPQPTPGWGLGCNRPPLARRGLLAVQAEGYAPCVQTLQDTLQQNTNLATRVGWTTSRYSMTTANGTNSITITPPTENLFFRLANP